jgi:hypothetical protein
MVTLCCVGVKAKPALRQHMIRTAPSNEAQEQQRAQWQQHISYDVHFSVPPSTATEEKIDGGADPPVPTAVLLVSSSGILHSKGTLSTVSYHQTRTVNYRSPHLAVMSTIV